MAQPAQARLTPSFLALSALLAWGLWPGRLAEGTPLRVLEALRNDQPSRIDTERMERGYYEQLLDVGRQLGSIADPAAAARNRAATPDAATAEDERLTCRTKDVREFVLKPNLARDPARRVPWSTNEVGMRDRSYTTTVPPATFRIGLAGDSIAAGWGVGDEEGFEPRLERLWNERAKAAGGPAVEVLNFAVPGHGPGQRWTHFETVGWAFHPDLVIYEATPADVGWDERRLRTTLEQGIAFDAPVYRDVLASAGMRPGLTAETYRRLLRPYRWEILAGVYRRVAADCRAHGVPVVWVLIPRVGKPIDPAEKRKLLELARQAGFAALVDAADAYAGADPATLAVSGNDFHPNADGHARIARILDTALGALPELKRLWAGGDRHDPEHEHEHEQARATPRADGPAGGVDRP